MSTYHNYEYKLSPKRMEINAATAKKKLKEDDLQHKKYKLQKSMQARKELLNKPTPKGQCKYKLSKMHDAYYSPTEDLKKQQSALFAARILIGLQLQAHQYRKAINFKFLTVYGIELREENRLAVQSYHPNYNMHTPEQEPRQENHLSAQNRLTPFNMTPRPVYVGG